MLNTWVSESVWYYSFGMPLQDMTLFPVSMVARKKAPWKVWEAFPEVTDVFARFSLGPADIAYDDLTLIERLVLLNERTGLTPLLMVQPLAFSRRRIGLLAMSNALLQDIHCSNLWSNSWLQDRNLLHFLADRSKFVWNGVSPRWMTIEEAAKSCQKLVRCWCKKNFSWIQM